MKVSVIVFPGSNCDHDAVHVYRDLLGARVSLVWHRDRDLRSPDIVVVPGGFAYGDYLRTGALAKISPVMDEIRKFAAAGGPVIGICNGFQILCECELLPGVLLPNRGMKFLSHFVNIKVERNDTLFTSNYAPGAVMTCPIAHNEGNYFADEGTIERLEGEGQVVFRYCGPNGEVADNYNPNGAAHSIAGICNETRNVVGMMPHPERAAEKVVGFVGSDSGLPLFKGSVEIVKAQANA